MSELIIYHNPKCSKSRQTLGLIKDRNINPKILTGRRRYYDQNSILLLKKIQFLLKKYFPSQRIINLFTE